MATQYTNILNSAVKNITMPELYYDYDRKNVTQWVNEQLAEASYPDVSPEHCQVTFDRQGVTDVVNGIWTSALNDAIRDRSDLITSVKAKVTCGKNPVTGCNCMQLFSIELTTTQEVDDETANRNLIRHLDMDCANVALEAGMSAFATGRKSKKLKAVVTLTPAAQRWHDLKTTDFNFFMAIACKSLEHFGDKPWRNAWDASRSESENFLHWVIKNHPDVDEYMQTIGMNPDPKQLPDAPQAEQPKTETPQPKAEQPKAETPAPACPEGYKVAPAPEGATEAQIAEQFRSWFDKALSATSPSGKTLADCPLTWTATARKDGVPGRLITCTVTESADTQHRFVFDCKDRHRDSYTIDEGITFAWKSVDAMIEVFSGRMAAVDGVNNRATLLKALGEADEKDKGEGNNEEMPQTETEDKKEKGEGKNMEVFKTYECEAGPSYYYHVYGSDGVGGILSVHKEDGHIGTHRPNQTLDSISDAIAKNKMQPLDEIPPVVITALIREGIIKTPMKVSDPEAEERETKAAAEAEAAAAKAKAEAEAKAAAEAEAKAKAEREAAERRAAEEAERKRKAEEEAEAKRRAAEEAEAKRKAEEAEAKRRAEEEAKRKAAGTHHPKFSDIIAITDCGEAVYGYGPSGTGKTHIAQQMAEHYGLPFTSNGCIYQPYELIGYMDANGNYHETAFVHAVRHGGMHLFDEFDRSCPQAPVICNSLLANGFIDLPNGERVTMHRDFHLFACGNTIGTGADADYTAAQPLEVSTLDRFTPVEILYDEQVEMSLAKGDAALVEFVHEMRRAIAECHYKHLLTYRAIIRMTKYMAVFPLEKALQLAIVRTMSRDDARNVYGNMNCSQQRNRYMAAFAQLCKSMPKAVAA